MIRYCGEEGDEGMLGNEGNDVLNGGEGVDIMAGGTGNDTFICDLFDTIIDFNLEEGDKIIGQCSSLDQTEKFETPSDNVLHKKISVTSGHHHHTIPNFPQENLPLEFQHQKYLWKISKQGPPPTTTIPFK